MLLSLSPKIIRVVFDLDALPNHFGLVVVPSAYFQVDGAVPQSSYSGGHTIRLREKYIPLVDGHGGRTKDHYLDSISSHGILLGRRPLG